MLLGACSTAPTLPPKEQVVVRVVKLKPDGLLQPCPEVQYGKITTNRELLAAYLAEREALGLCRARMHSLILWYQEVENGHGKSNGF